MSYDLNREQIASIVNDISTAGAAFANGESNAREQLLGLAHRLTASLELPSEAVMRMGWAEPARTAHCKIAVDLKVFELLKEKGSHGMTSDRLASASESDPTLMARMMRHLAAMNVVDETKDAKYIATRLSNGFTEEKFRDGISYVYNVPGPSFRALPEYLKKTSYQNPTSLFNGPFQHAHSTDQPFFGWLGEHPAEAATFNHYMAGYRTGRPTWMESDPIVKHLFSTYDAASSPTLLVDVGGGMGHDLVKLKSKYPDLPGNLILQDQASVISSIKDAQAPFQATAHDFFTAQTVKNARVYHLHSVLHDWDDEQCVKILSNLVPAMKSGYSTVFIFEMAVPDHSAPWPVTSMDWLMAVLGGMHERTLKEWESILAKAGLKVKNLWTFHMGSESLIEAELA